MKFVIFFYFLLLIPGCTSNYLRGFINRNQNNKESNINMVNLNQNHCDNEFVYTSIYEVWLECFMIYKTRERQRANSLH